MGCGDGSKAQNLNEPQSRALSVCPAALNTGLLWKENLSLDAVSPALGAPSAPWGDPKHYLRVEASELGAPLIQGWGRGA